MHRIRQSFALSLVLLLLALSVWSIYHELKEYRIQDIWQSLATISTDRKLSAIALTGVGYLLMTGYDMLAFHHIRRPLARAKIMLTSFLSYAIGNTVGFTALSGTAIRYRFYSRWGVPPLDIAQVIVLTHLCFWLGIFAIGGTVFLIDPLTIPTLLKLPFRSIHPIGIIFLLIVALYFLISVWLDKPLRIGRETIRLPPLKLSLVVIGLTALDWAFASGVLYLLLPTNFPLSYLSFVGIYILALISGVISSVPGGLGVFETVILLLRPSSVAALPILAALFAYRAIYYFLPLIAAVGLLIAHEIKHRRSV